MRYSKLRAYLLVFLAAFIAISGPIATFAIDEATLDMFAENNIMFYDPDEADIKGCNPSNYSTKPTGNQITWIGDSYSVGAKSIIEKKLSGIDFGQSDSYIQVSKFVSSDKADVSGGSSGLTLLEQIINNKQLRPYLVFALGTNGGWTEADIKKLLSLTQNQKVKIVLVNSKTLEDDYRESNGFLQDAINKNSDKLYLADWTQVFKDSLMSDDKIHPNSAGYEAWVDTIYNALPSGSNRVTEGNSLEEFIWNFFKNQGFEDHQVAGILGNAAQETGGTFHPTIQNITGTHFGLFQWMKSLWEPLKTILDREGYSKYTSVESTSQNLSYIPEEYKKAMLEIEMQYAIEKGAATKGEVWVREVKSTKTVREATEAFLTTFEGSIGKEYDQPIQEYEPYKGKKYQEVEERVNYAEKYYDQLKNTSTDPRCGAISSDAKDPLAYMQQFIIDTNYLYSRNIPIPQNAKIGELTNPIDNSGVIKPTDAKFQQLGIPSSKQYSASCWGGTYCGQCTAFSGWFVTMMTGYKYGGGAGISVVNNLVAITSNSLSLSTTPTPFSVFSGPGRTVDGHTGVVIDVLETGEIITVENNIRGEHRLGIRQYKPGANMLFVDMRNSLNLRHLGERYE